MKMKYLLLALSLWVGGVAAETALLAQDAQRVKEQVLQLNKDLYQLEKDLLSPATTEIAFYLSLRATRYFSPLSVEINTQGIPSIHHLYTEREVEALLMGAVHPIASDNIGPGAHQVEVIVRGKDESGAEQVIKMAQQVEKQAAPLLLEIVVSDNRGASAAVMQLTTWN